jgi:SAM-dependent methyltransferase
MDPRPTPEALLALYDERYFASDDPHCGYAVYTADREALVDKATRLLDALERHGPRGRLLDVGCAYGFLLEVARARGWDVAAVEPATAVAAQVSARFGIPVPRDLAAAAHPDASFDAVTLWDVIEHLPEPRAELAEVARVLKPGGLCSVVTPDIDSLAARLLGRRWEEVQKLPEHVCFFGRASLGRLLEASGLRPIAWGTVGKRMALEEVLVRLTPTAPRLIGPLHALARGLGFDRHVGYFDPLWKLWVVARLERGAAGTP